MTAIRDLCKNSLIAHCHSERSEESDPKGHFERSDTLCQILRSSASGGLPQNDRHEGFSEASIITFILFVLLTLSSGCAMANWPGKVYQNPTHPLSNYRTFSFTLPVTANIMEDRARDKIIKLLEKKGYKYVEAKETADLVVEERLQWEEKIGYVPPRVEYTPVYTHTSVIYIPYYTPERPYTYYEFSASLTFYDGVSQEKIYEGTAEGTTSSLDLGEIYQDLMKQGNLPISVGRPKVLTKESYKVYTTRRSKIYHRAGCPELGAEELVEFKSPEEADAAGATACQKCKP